MESEDFAETQEESLKKIGQETEAEFSSQTQEESALLNILFTLQNSFLKFVEVYKPVVEKTEMFYGYYRRIYDEKHRGGKRFLLILSRILININNYMISIRKKFDKIGQELQFIDVIIDGCLTSAIDFFFESANRIHHTLVSVNILIKNCINNLEGIHDVARKFVSLRRN